MNNAKDDRERLASMVSPAPHGMHDSCVHDTLVGAFIIYGVEGVKIELFENVNGRGENTETFEISREELPRYPSMFRRRDPLGNSLYGKISPDSNE